MMGCLKKNQKRVSCTQKVGPYAKVEIAKCVKQKTFLWIEVLLSRVAGFFNYPTCKWDAKF